MHDVAPLAASVGADERVPGVHMQRRCYRDVLSRLAREKRSCHGIDETVAFWLLLGSESIITLRLGEDSVHVNSVDLPLQRFPQSRQFNAPDPILSDDGFVLLQKESEVIWDIQFASALHNVSRHYLDGLRSVTISAHSFPNYSATTVHEFVVSRCRDVIIQGFQNLRVFISYSRSIRIMGSRFTDSFHIVLGHGGTESSAISVDGLGGNDSLTVTSSHLKQLHGLYIFSIVQISQLKLHIDWPTVGSIRNREVFLGNIHFQFHGDQPLSARVAARLSHVVIQDILFTSFFLTSKRILAKGYISFQDAILRAPYIIFCENSSTFVASSLKVGQPGANVTVTKLSEIFSVRVKLDGKYVGISGIVNGSRSVVIGSETTDKVHISGCLLSLGTECSPGSITVFATRSVALLQTAQIVASNNLYTSRNGGIIRIGIQHHGETPTRNVFVHKGAVVRSDASCVGNGGHIILLAYFQTYFFGMATARGGVHGGNAGIIEISAVHSLCFHGITDLTAPNGQDGLLLLDPISVVIQELGADDSLLPTILFSSTPNFQTLSASAIEAALLSGDVLISANSSITLNAQIGNGTQKHTLSIVAGTF